MSAKREKIKEHQLVGFKYFKAISGLLEKLHDAGNPRDTAGNRMLIALWTGRRPTLRTYEMLCWYFTGMASAEELQAHIDRLQKQE